MSQRETEVIDEAQELLPGRVEYLGPVYGEDKVRFFERLNAFVFPTGYHNESWGIVLNEALAAGVPVIATGRACIPYVVGEGGHVVRDEERFAEEAASVLRAWWDDPPTYEAIVESALRQAKKLDEEAVRKLDGLFDAILLE